MAGEVQQKYSRKENLNEKKKNSCTPSYPKKNIHALARKNSFKGNVNKKKMRLETYPRPT